MQSARNALRCFGTIAVSLFVLSASPAFGEPTTNEADVRGAGPAASAVTLAALVPAALNADEVETERPSVIDRIVLSAEHAIVGIASFYDEPQKTASGEQYDPNAYTAAAQLEIRNRFGGIRYGRLYQPAYGLGEYDGKKIIVRFNDVGPLRPGRKFDLSRAAMAYFDSTLDKGLLPGFRMTPLPLGRTYPKGPVTDQQLAELGIEQDWTETACADVLEEAVHTASIAPPTAREAARPAQAKPSSTVHAGAKAKVAAKTKAAAKTKVAAKASVKKVKAAARGAAKTEAATQQADQARPPVTPWIKRVVNWVASKNAAETPAPQSSTRVAKAVAQAR